MPLPEAFTTTAGDANAALARRGIGLDAPAMIILKPVEDAAGADVRAHVVVFVKGVASKCTRRGGAAPAGVERVINPAAASVRVGISCRRPVH